MTNFRIAWRYQQTLDHCIRWCEAHDKTRFRGSEVNAPRGHLMALVNRGRIKKAGKDDRRMVYELVLR